MGTLTAKKIINYSLILFTIAHLLGCAPITKGYSIKPLNPEEFSSTKKVEIYRARPEQEHTVIASFTGQEPGKCKTQGKFCKLRKHGRSLGADAIWIQGHHITQHPGEWILVEGKMTKIHAFTTDTYHGVFIRFVAK